MKAPKVLLLDREQSFNGPDGLILQLNANEILAYRPVSHTDVAIILMEAGPADFEEALAAGGVDGIPFTQAQLEWLKAVEAQVEEWLFLHVEVAEQAWRQENNTPTMYWSAKEARAE